MRQRQAGWKSRFGHAGLVLVFTIGVLGLSAGSASAAPPVLTSPGTQGSTQGSAIPPLTIAASDPDAGQTLTFSATGLPAGLVINRSTGVVSGTPTTVQATTVTVTATDNGTPAESSSTVFTWTIVAPVANVYRAINLNGPAITAGGINFESGTTAANFTAGPNSFCNQAVPLAPATDVNTAAMLRCSIWGTGSPGARLSMTSIPSGTYQVSVYVWEDNASQTFSVAMNGTTVAASVVSGAAGSWQRLGPYAVSITAGTLAINTTGGDANLSGLVVTNGGGSASGNRAPVVTNPTAQTSKQGTVIAPLTIAASDPDTGQTLTFSATGLPAGLVLNASTGVISGTPTTVQSTSVTVTATDNGTPALSTATTFSWTVSAGSGTGGGSSTVYRAINLNGQAITAGGINFEAGTTALNFTAGPNSFCNQAVPLLPATDASTATMLRCSNWGTGTTGARVSMTSIPSGTYQVYVYVWEDTASQTFSLVMNGATVAPNVVSGAAGTWQVLGPYAVGISAGTLAINTSGGDANLSGLVLMSTTGGGSANRAPTITTPSSQSSTQGTAIAPLTIAATDPDTGQSLTFSATGLPAGLALNASTGVISGTPTTVQSSSVTVTATDNGAPALSGSATFTWTVSTSGGGSGGGVVTFDPTKVTDTFVAGGNWSSTLSADWLANGHMLVLTQRGLIYNVNPATGAQSLELDLSAKVHDAGELGALDLLVDPAGTGYYLYYAVEGSDRLRVSHFTVGSSAEQVIWNNPGLGYDTTSPYHAGGSLNIGPDGKLYISIGDRTQGLSQDLTNVFGKILRINTNGTVPTDNPFFDGTGPHIDEIWAYGLRNPYRASFDKTTGIYWVGDVGGNVDNQAYEEVDIVEAGHNYGWPGCEGPLGLPKNGPLCPGGVTGPVFSYPHNINGGCCFNRAIIGGEIYHGSVFPLAGYYVYADYPSDTFFWLKLGADGRTAAANGTLSTGAAPTPVWMGVGPDGYIYWLSLGGQLRKLGYSGSVNAPPTISTSSATPTSGSAPLAVSFTGAATDPDGTPVTYAWDFGDHTSSALASPTHTYTAKGMYSARLLVSSGGNSVSGDPITIVVGTPPSATITSPADGTKFNAGQTITFTGTGTDPTTGPLPASALSWNILFLHNAHSHPGITGTGSSITFAIPTTGHDYSGTTRYLVSLTATNSDGLSKTTSITIWPNKVMVGVTSNKADSMTVDNVTQTLPFGIDTVIGFQHTISVPASTCASGQLWNFSTWSDGGARTHTITVTAGLSLVATYVNSGSSCSTIGTLRYSVSNTRANPLSLDGATLSRARPVYVFLDTVTTDYKRVEFWLDQPVTTTPRQVEALAPYDFAGGATATANPFNLGTLTAGHTITSRATRSDGTTGIVTATFTVGP